MMSNAGRPLWAEPRPPRPPRRVWRDWVLLALLAASLVAEVTFREELSWGPVSVGFPLVVAIALVARRTFPLAAVMMAFGASAVVSIATVLGAEPLVPYSAAWVLVLPYSLLRWGSGREAAIGLPVMLLSALLGIASDWTDLVEAVVGIAFLLFPAALGASVRYRANARLRELDQVKLLEREQLARELHDTVAHHVSAIAIQAQAGREVAASRPDRAVEALEIIEEAASRTLDEMRAMVGALRDGEEPDLAPQRGVMDIGRLAGNGGGGPRIEVELSGDLDDLSPSLGAALYRLAQESITNAVRHARHATRIQVLVTGEAERVRLVVNDDGESGSSAPRTWGYGLVGMSERATLLGGTLEAGPRPGKGWTVDAVLPRSGAAT